MLEKGKVNSSQMFCMVSLFIVGSSTLLQSITSAGRDTWLSHIIAMLAGIVYAWVLTAMGRKFPDKTLIEYLQEVFGKPLGKMLGVMYLWYFIHLGALVLRNNGDFFTNMVMPETPLWFFLLTFGLVVAYYVFNGIEVIGRLSELAFPIVICLSFLISLLITLSGHTKYSINLRPFLEHGLTRIFQGAIPIAAFPFQEIILFAMIFPFLNQLEKSRKVTMGAVLFTGCIMLLVLLQGIAIFGEYMAALVFPRYFAVRMISVGQFIERIDPVILTSWILASLVKTGICLYAFVLGTAQLTGMRDYKPIVVPAALLMILLAQILYDNTFEMLNFAVNIYPIYAFPFQILIPLVVLFMALIRKKRTPGTKSQGEKLPQ